MCLLIYASSVYNMKMLSVHLWDLIGHICTTSLCQAHTQRRGQSKAIELEALQTPADTDSMPTGGWIRNAMVRKLNEAESLWNRLEQRTGDLLALHSVDSGSKESVNGDAQGEVIEISVDVPTPAKAPRLTQHR